MSTPDIVDRLESLNNAKDGAYFLLSDLRALVRDSHEEILRLRSSASDMRERAAGVAAKMSEEFYHTAAQWQKIAAERQDHDARLHSSEYGHMHAAASNIAAAIRSLPDEGDGWRTIDSAPHVDHADIIVYCDGEYIIPHYSYEEPPSGRRVYVVSKGDEQDYFSPSHWRPLPPPPRDAT